VSQKVEPIFGAPAGSGPGPRSETIYPEYTIVEPSLWSLKGRIGRESFWTRMLILGAVNMVVGFVVPSVGNLGRLAAAVAVILYLVCSVGLVWLAIVTQVKRWHDMDKSGWMVAWNLTFLYIPIAIVILGCIRGTTGPNQFGADPLRPPVSFRGIAG